jgi:hypothetical protein
MSYSKATYRLNRKKKPLIWGKKGPDTLREEKQPQHGNTQGSSSLPLPANPVPGLCMLLFPGFLPPCSSSLDTTSFTTQLQIHSHQEVFLSKPFFSASSQSGYIWFPQRNLVYVVSGKGRFLRLFIF